MRLDATQKRGYIAPHALINKRKFITVTCLTGLIYKQGLGLWNISILWGSIKVIVVFLSLQYFTLPIELILFLFSSFTLITPCSNIFV